MTYYTNYNAIVSAVTEVYEDNSQEFLNYIPKAIELAQFRLEDEVDLDLMNTPVEVTCVASSPLILKPSNFRFVNNIFVQTSTANHILKKVSTDYLRDYSASVSGTGIPKYYSTDYSVDYFMVSPTPASAYTLKTDLRENVVYLSETNPENTFTKYCANTLFFATMVEQMDFAKNPEAKAAWNERYLNSVQGVNNRGRRSRRQDGGSASTVESGKNTLMGTK